MTNSPDKPQPVPDTVNCSVCRKEIPRTDALKDEGDEYIRWFCGFDCYHQRQPDSSSDKQ